MESIAQRIKELIESQELSNSEFAKQTNINPAIVSHILSGRNKPSLQVIQSIKDTFTNVNLDYLINGSGSLYNGFTNVNEQKITPDLPLQAGFDFPMEGLRVASLGQPSPAPSSESKPAQADTATEQMSAEKQAPAKAVNTTNKVEDQEIEQIVIFYRDGSFKAYRP